MSGIPGTASTGNPVAVDVITDALFSATDGATIMPSGLPYSGSGIIVALPESDQHGYVLNWGDALFDRLNGGRDAAREVVEIFVKLNQHVVSGPHERPRAFGAWVESGTGTLPDGATTDRIHLDVVEIFADDDEAAAIAAGRARNQIAVWHAGRGEEIPTGGTGFDYAAGTYTRTGR